MKDVYVFYQKLEIAFPAITEGKKANGALLCFPCFCSSVLVWGLQRTAPITTLSAGLQHLRLVAGPAAPRRTRGRSQSTVLFSSLPAAGIACLPCQVENVALINPAR